MAFTKIIAVDPSLGAGQATLIDIPGGGTTPTGTGWRHITNGVEDGVASTPTKADVGLGSVDNTSDTGKPISTAQQTALNLKADLSGATFTGAIGYASGSGGMVTQLTSKSTGVTLNKLCGKITMNGAALAAAGIVSFTLTNSNIAATDFVHLQHQATGTFGAYTLNPRCAAGSAIITIRNNTAGSLSEAIVIAFAVIKGVTA